MVDKVNLPVGGLNTDEEDVHGKRRRRSSSAESIVMTRTNPVITTVPSASKISAIASAANSIQVISNWKMDGRLLCVY